MFIHLGGPVNPKDEKLHVRSGSNASWVNNLFQEEAGSIGFYLLLIITVIYKSKCTKLLPKINSFVLRHSNALS